MFLAIFPLSSKVFSKCNAKPTNIPICYLGERLMLLLTSWCPNIMWATCLYQNSAVHTLFFLKSPAYSLNNSWLKNTTSIYWTTGELPALLEDMRASISVLLENYKYGHCWSHITRISGRDIIIWYHVIRLFISSALTFQSVVCLCSLKNEYEWMCLAGEKDLITMFH